jgi:hypothetical protein
MVKQFAKQLEIGEAFEKVLDAHFASEYQISKATLIEQRTGIDRWFESEDGGRISVEYKSDSRAADTGNAFVEIVSVSTRNIAGWAYTSHANTLIYYLPQPRICYHIGFDILRQELDGWRVKYPARNVRNSDYFTTGLLVPIGELAVLAFDISQVTPDSCELLAP